MSNKFNGLPVLYRQKTAFVRLPEFAQTPIEGGCQCDFCKKHPNLTPQWDTMALQTDGKIQGYTWTVHHPEKI